MMPQSGASGREGRGDLALVLSGGGARAAYQTGVLRFIARNFPSLRFPIITGVSAGAINAAFLASHSEPPAEAAPKLCDLWSNLQVENIFDVDISTLARTFIQWGTRLGAGGSDMAPDVRGLVDTRPLEETIRRVTATVDGELVGIGHNLERGQLKAVALTTLNYTTGQTVVWVQGADLKPWSLPLRHSVSARITVSHVMASSALPLIFPAVRIGDSWHGDGGVRLTAPLGPALRLGASRMLAISPHYPPSAEEAGRHQITGYPPPAQILSHMLNAVFLDAMDEDVRRLISINPLLEKLPPDERRGLRPVDILIMRPSQDLGKLAASYEPRLPKAFRYLTRSLGTRETTSPDFLSYLMFQPDYLQRLIELGEADAEARRTELEALLEG
jgi:NTE family protein